MEKEYVIYQPIKANVFNKDWDPIKLIKYIRFGFSPYIYSDEDIKCEHPNYTLRVVGSFCAVGYGDGSYSIGVSICDPYDYFYGFKNKMSKKIAYGKASKSVAIYPHRFGSDIIVSNYDRYCFYMLPNDIKMQYEEFIQRCNKYFKLDSKSRPVNEMKKMIRGKDILL